MESLHPSGDALLAGLFSSQPRYRSITSHIGEAFVADLPLMSYCFSNKDLKCPKNPIAGSQILGLQFGEAVLN